jgi:cyclase
MKKLLASNLFAMLIITSGGFGFSQPFDSPHFKLYSIGDDVYAAIHKPGGQAICNAGFVDLGKEVIVFDSFLSIAAARDFKEAIREMTGKPVRWLVNSHSHNDHIRGNQVFVPGASILSSAAIRDDLVNHGREQADAEQSYATERVSLYQGMLEESRSDTEREDAKMWLGYFKAMAESYPDLKITPPDLVFKDSITIYGNKRAVKLIEFQQGHMESDIVLYLPEEQILFTGDLVFIEMHPYLADGDPLGLKKTLTKLLEWPVEIVVPGHGRVGNKDDIQVMIDYIDMTGSMAEKLKKQGKKPEDISNEDIPEPFRDWLFSMFFQANLKFLYDAVTVQ